MQPGPWTGRGKQSEQSAARATNVPYSRASSGQPRPATLGHSPSGHLDGVQEPVGLGHGDRPKEQRTGLKNLQLYGELAREQGSVLWQKKV